MAKHKAKLPLATEIDIEKRAISQTQRENNVWFCLKLLEAARAGHLLVYTSSMTISECTHIESGQMVPPQETMDFFNMLLNSGTSGITLVQPLQTIQIASRDLGWKTGLNLKPKDALHLASALHMGCTEFLTTDNRFSVEIHKLSALKMRIIQPSHTSLLPERYRQDELGGIVGEPH